MEVPKAVHKAAAEEVPESCALGSSGASGLLQMFCPGVPDVKVQVRYVEVPDVAHRLVLLQRLEKVSAVLLPRVDPVVQPLQFCAGVWHVGEDHVHVGLREVQCDDAPFQVVLGVDGRDPEPPVARDKRVCVPARLRTRHLDRGIRDRVGLDGARNVPAEKENDARVPFPLRGASPNRTVVREDLDEVGLDGLHVLGLELVFRKRDDFGVVRGGLCEELRSLLQRRPQPADVPVDQVQGLAGAVDRLPGRLRALHELVRGGRCGLLLRWLGARPARLAGAALRPRRCSSHGAREAERWTEGESRREEERSNDRASD
mmetsp:Transcript_9454/g.23550  ORF Transcript_9454/g.23550 Transcript_9454/m.23550 type:complete len:316 (+) Transcript_9454:293-1240(+)